MSNPPTYPEDTPVGEAQAAAAAAGRQAATRTRRFVTGAAIGIGSAAIVAALLYSNRSKKGSKSAD